MVTCPNCGQSVQANQRFCGSCGADVEATPVTRGTPIGSSQSAPYAYSQPSNYVPGESYTEPKKNTGRLLIIAVVLLLVCCCALACGLIAVELYLNTMQPSPPATKPSGFLLPLIAPWIA